MRKLFLVLLTTFFCLNLFSWTSGVGGTLEEPYLITNVSDLQQLATEVNAGNQFAGEYFKQTSDFDLDGVSWTPIGNDYSYYFSGNYDGDNHSIINLTINSTTMWTGFFGNLGNESSVIAPEIKNLNISANVISSSELTGILAGYAGDYSDSGYNYKFINCNTSGTLQGRSTCGGLVGNVRHCTFINCSSSADVTGFSQIGGLIGNAGSSTFEKCYFNGNITSTCDISTYDIGDMGGLFGNYQKTTLINSYYGYKQVDCNGRNIISAGALDNNQLNDWLSNNRELNINDYFTQNAQLDYVISDLTDLKNMLGFVYSSTNSFILQNNIDLSSTPDFFFPFFNGTFKGNNKTINGLNVDYYTIPTDGFGMVGFFGYLEGATVKDLSITNARLEASTQVGGFAGDARYNVTIDNCSFSGEVICYNNDTGGLVGNISEGTITNSRSSGIVRGLGNYSYAAGFVGGTEFVIFSNCSNDTEVFSEINGVNGFSTNLMDSEVSQCYSSGTLYCPSNGNGFSGYAYNSRISDCYSSTNMVCTAETPSTDFSGFIWQLADDSSVNNCYSTGWVKLGSTTGTNIDCSGFIANPIGTASHCFWDKDASGCTISTGEGIGVIEGCTTAQMKNILTFTNGGWDFTGETVNGTADNWAINPAINDGYPYLSNSGTPDTPLPVELSAFTGCYTNSGNISLSWTTQSESNVHGFYIFRNTINDCSTALKTNLNIIPATNTSQTHVYTYTDNNTESSDPEYYYWLQFNELGGTSSFYGPIKVINGNNNPETPETGLKTVLHPSYPNPFNPTTTISYELAVAASAKIVVYNAKGQLVKDLSQGYKEPGIYRINWNGLNKNNKTCTSGVYFLKMTAGNYSSIQKIMLMK